jgi:DNA-binding transcriptional ArsR family regulator
MSLAAVSKHIQVLERAGLVKRTREGREHVLSLDARPMREVARYASKFEKFWNERLDRLEAFVIEVEHTKKEKK